MGRGSTSRFFTGAYSLLRSTGILETRWAARAFVSSYFLYKRLWEDPFRGLVRRHPGIIGDGDVLDIGANVGYTACVFAAALKPKRRVYAFEPDAAAFRTLTGVVERRKLSDSIVAVNAAVGANDGTVEFWHNADHAADHRVMTERFKARHAAATDVSRVEMVRVDSFVLARGLENVSFIKIDVQGFEPAVCEGMAQTLARFPDATVCCEYSPASFVELGFEPAAMLAFFASRNYVPHILERSGAASVVTRAAIESAAQADGYVDLLFSQRALGERSG